MSAADVVEGTQLASEEQLERWVRTFRFYRHPPSREDIIGWLARFEQADVPIAHKILDAVLVVSEIEIHEIYKRQLEEVKREAPATEPPGRWFFTGFGGPGESGTAMLRLFREANNMMQARWNSQFVAVRELPYLKLTAFDTVVFVDDFAGSGEQVSNYWPLMQELVASEAACHLLLTAATSRAIEKIRTTTELELRAGLTLGPDRDLFDEQCEVLTAEERTAIDPYGTLAWERWPRGFADCGLTVVLSHKTPNNTIPILHANHDRWVGLFPRKLLRAA